MSDTGNGAARGATLVVAGIALGFALSRIGFTSYDEVHAMFTMTSFRLTLTFATAVALLVPTWWLIAARHRRTWPSRDVHPGTVPGGVLFGLGWALCGACPGVALVQLGELQLGAAVTFAGIAAGNALYAWAHPRYFRWTAGSCSDL